LKQSYDNSDLMGLVLASDKSGPSRVPDHMKPTASSQKKRTSPMFHYKKESQDNSSEIDQKYY